VPTRTPVSADDESAPLRDAGAPPPVRRGGAAVAADRAADSATGSAVDGAVDSALDSAPDGVVDSAAAATAAGARARRYLFWAIVSSWLLWWPAAAVSARLPHGFANLAIVLGTLCIALVAGILLFARDSAAQRSAYWRALIGLRGRVPAGLALAALLMPALALTAALADAVVRGHPLQGGPVVAGGLPFLPYLKTFAFGLLLGPLAEELGWRGYALAPLQLRYGVLRGALVLALVHALWHLPLFFLAGSAQQKLGFLTPDFWHFMAAVLVFDLIVAALYVWTGGSTLAAVVLHASFNLATGLFVLSPFGAQVQDGLFAALGLLCVLALASDR
jgi:membrane protease YdiL (CAAX protease family)